jgi:epoxide hydrolase 4
MKHRYAFSGGVRLHYVEMGSGPLLVLLHGIPETWLAWRRFIPLLAEAGFKVAAADLRGYGRSHKPHRVDDYRSDLLADDVAAIVRSRGRERATVVGHSWGGLQGWMTAMRYPEMVDRLVVMNVPHPFHWVEAMRTWGFWRRNPQMLLFQIPALPEWVLGARDHAALRLSLRRDLRAVDHADREAYLAAIAQPGALTGALNYYRAFLRENPLRLRRPLRVVEAPVLVVWGTEDRFFPADRAAPPRTWAPNARVEVVAGAGHWTHHDRPTVVSDLLLEFLAAG